MNAARLRLFAGLTLAVVIAAVVAVQYAGSPGRGDLAPAPLAPGLGANINTVAGVRISTDAHSFTLRRDDTGQWTLPEKSGYPAAFEKIKTLIVSAARAEKTEPKTAKPEKYAKIKVADPGSGTGAGTLVSLVDNEGKNIFAVILGRRNTGARGGKAWTYVRRPGEARAWLVSGLPEVGDDAVGWLDSDILSVSRERVRAARVTHTDGQVLEVIRATPGDSDFTVIDLPKEAELEYPGAANGPGSALSSLTFEDVAKAADFDFAKPTRAVFETFDGLRISVATIEAGDHVWATLGADYDPALIVESPEQGAAVVTDSPPDVAAEAKRLDARLSGWAYRLPDYQSKSLRPRLADLIKTEKTDDDSSD